MTRVYDPSLVLYLPLDEGSGNIAHDQTAYQNNGTIYGASWINGKIGRALSFDGVDDKVVIPASSVFNFTSVISAFIWVYSRVTNVNQVALCQHIWSAPRRGWYIQWNDGFDKLRVRLSNPSSSFYPGVTTPSINQWHHVGFVFNRPSFKLYVDGNIVYTGSWDYDIYDPSDLPIYIGVEADYAFLNGFIDETRIYNRALSDHEIAWLYSFGKIRHGSVPALARRVGYGGWP